MIPLDLKHPCVFMMKVLMLYGMFLNFFGVDSCSLKKVLFVALTQPQCQFPTEVTLNRSRFCFYVNGNETQAGCCKTEDFNCNIAIKSDAGLYNLILNNDILSKHDVVVMRQPDQNYECPPSRLYRAPDHHESCLNIRVNNVKLSQSSPCGQNSMYKESSCTGLQDSDYKLTIDSSGNVACVSCKKPGKQANVSIILHTTPITRPENAEAFMRNLTHLKEKIGNSTTASITAGDIKGVITKIPLENPSNIIIGFTTSGDPWIGQDSDVMTGFSYSVRIPSEASAMALNKNSSLAAIVLFPRTVPYSQQDDPNVFIFNNKVVGIEMGAEIRNLSHTIDIQFTDVNKNGNIASCSSWDGKGNKSMWITDGCDTVEDGDSIKCQCSHLTFFALLMSPPPGNISSSDYKSLTYITSIGCGLSMFFLAVAIFMHFLIRKGKASQAAKILMNLFIAMFILNLFFLVNKSIARLGIFGACVATAAVMHYTMLATFSWFFAVALHICLNLRKLSVQIKHYLIKIYIIGWATPAVVVIALIATNKYGFMTIYIDDGSSAKMCWITDPIIHQAVNIGYYAGVFIFTFGILLTVPMMVSFRPATGIVQHRNVNKKNCFSIVSLLCLLGITWAFAFFSFGPLLLASYYMFSILNSFQGFFLFIYYYKSNKLIGEDNNKSSSTVKSDIPVKPYQ